MNGNTNEVYSVVATILITCDYISPADKTKNCSLFDKSTKIGMHVSLIILNHLR